jgi:F-type H+-transporting ATPase subunit b
MFLQLDGTFFVQLINFAIFFALLTVVFIRPVGNAIAKRREYINSLTNDYDRYQAEAQSLRAQAETIRATARREAEAHLAKVRADATNEAGAITAQYAEQVEKTIQGAQNTVAAELGQARANQSQIVGDLANMMVQRTVTEAAQ